MLSIRFLACCLLLSPLALAQDTPPTVDLGYATYQGAYVLNNTRFLGIRYASPPTGGMRWRAPQEPEPAVGVQDATLVPNACPSAGRGVSITNPVPRAAAASVSEDCLFLSVFSPGINFTDVNFAKPLPVIVWIHGGGYISGSSTYSGFSGDDLIREAGNGVVAVSIQYRLGLFGFLAGQAVKNDGDLNVGLRDQQFALQWVQKHISKFGGDPTRVTIWGESAGAGSVMQQVIANGGATDPPLFRAAITSSTFYPSQYHYNHSIPEFWFEQLVNTTNCTSADDSLACIRSVSSESLQSANSALNPKGYYGTYVFVPVVDGSFIQQSPSKALNAKQLNGHMYLGVTNTDEGSAFVNLTNTTVVLSDYIANLFPDLSAANLEAATEMYASAGLGNATAQVSAVMDETIFVCATYYLLKAFQGAAFKSQFAIPPARHGGDLPYYYSTNNVRAFNNTDFLAAFSESFLAVVTSMDPNLTFNETITPPWPQYTYDTPVERTEMMFNKTADTPGEPVIEIFVTNEALIERCAFWDKVGEEIGH